ncbi:unnamed protein product [Linum trigynum]|uniref:Uncharacterized protein n=1 Tax=Linum trigynum TaxID=586398 RepID=A0AAV2F5N4_9ROSI
MREIDNFPITGKQLLEPVNQSSMVVIGSLSALPALQELDCTPGVELNTNSPITLVTGQLKTFNIASQFCSGNRTNPNSKQKLPSSFLSDL